MDAEAEALAKTFWAAYEPIVRAEGHIENGPMSWEQLIPGTRTALIKTFKLLLLSDIIRPGSEYYRPPNLGRN
jgi:hypothetical protein